MHAQAGQQSPSHRDSCVQAVAKITHVSDTEWECGPAAKRGERQLLAPRARG
jgi:hypothetical protein